MNLAELLQLKFPEADFRKDIILADEGEGPFIRAFNLGDMPTTKDLAQWEKDLDLAYRQKLAVESRIYPTIGDQLDMQYKDMRDNTSHWFETIAAIKAAHPKPTV